MFSGHNSQRCFVAGVRQQSRRAAVSSLTLSCFDRQHTCILVESLVGDDLAAPCAAHTRKPGTGGTGGRGERGLAPVSGTWSSLESVSLEDAVAGSNSRRAWDAAGLVLCLGSLWLPIQGRHRSGTELLSHFYSEKNEKMWLFFSLVLSSSYLVTSDFLHNLFFPTVGLKKSKKADYGIYLFRSGVLRICKVDGLHQNVLKMGSMCHVWLEVNLTAAEMPSMCLWDYWFFVFFVYFLCDRWRWAVSRIRY